MKVSFRKSEKDILERIRHGDKQVMEEVYFRYREEFLKWSQGKYDISENDALDKYQDTVTIFFEKVIQGSIGDIESSLKTFLFGIGKNRILQQFDKEARRGKHDEGLTEHYRFLVEHEDAAESHEEAKSLTRELFKELSDGCKTILKLFYYEKKSMSEIANIMGHKSEGVSRTTKKRCLEKIRSQMKKPLANG
ncbi:MAG: sigma-70 family RNA polymerase sigma factor [Bacteroidota bacterium]